MQQDNNEFISIIMAAYNTEAYIARALDSVLAAADSGCEIIVVDDGSTDDTRRIAHEYEERDPRVFVIEQAHGGVSEARKNGVEMCSGDSVVFVDSDDTIPPSTISDMRAATQENTEIVCGNKVTFGLDGKKALSLSGPSRTLTSEEFLKHILTTDTKFSLLGKKFARRLFDSDSWDTHPVMAGMFHRALLLQLVSRVKGDVVILPSVNMYNYHRRPMSNSSMLQVRPASVERLWNTLSNLPLPRHEFVDWALDLLNHTLIERGITFENSFPPAADLRALGRGIKLDKEHKEIYRLLGSRRSRLKKARNLLYEGNLTVITPHISFIIVAHNNYKDVLRTMRSIFFTGFRNIEVIVIDDGCNMSTSVKLNALNVHLRRVRLRKNETRLGLQASRLKGVEMAKGSAVVFAEAGGTIDPEGILEALDQVDAGSDVAIFPVEMRDGVIGTHSFFSPMDMPDFKGDYEQIVDALLGNNQLPPSFSTFVVSKAFLDKVFRGRKNPDFEEEMLSLIYLYAAKPIITRVPTVGFVFGSTHAPRQKMLEKYCQHIVVMAHRVLSIIRDKGLETDVRREMVAARLTNAIVRAVSERRKKWFYGKVSARRLAEAVLSNEETKAFYEDARVPVPEVEECLRLAAEARRHPRPFAACMV